MLEADSGSARVQQNLNASVFRKFNIVAAGNPAGVDRLGQGKYGETMEQKGIGRSHDEDASGNPKPLLSTPLWTGFEVASSSNDEVAMTPKAMGARYLPGPEEDLAVPSPSSLRLASVVDSAAASWP